MSVIFTLEESDIPDTNIKDSIKEFMKDYESNSNYIVLWGEKEFLFSIIGKLNQEFENTKDKDFLNLVLLSGFNGNILK